MPAAPSLFTWRISEAKAAPAEAGDVWTWTAIDADSKLIVSWLVGGRDADYALEFMSDLQDRLSNRVQLTTDGHSAYLQAVEATFGADVDYAQLVKLYGTAPESARGRYSPAECIGAKPTRVEGSPDPAHVSTSYVERQNLTMRMSMRRFTRLTNAFSKKLDNHMHALALYFFHYNWCRQHKAHRLSPAMASKLTDRLLSWETILERIDEAKKPGKRGPYVKRAQAKA